MHGKRPLCLSIWAQDSVASRIQSPTLSTVISPTMSLKTVNCSYCYNTSIFRAYIVGDVCYCSQASLGLFSNVSGST